MLLSIKLFLFFVSGWYTGKYFWMRNLAILYHELCLLIWNFLPAGICWQRNYSYWNIDSPWIPLLLSIASASWFSLSEKEFGGHRCMKGLRSGERRRVSIQVNIFGALFLLPNSYSQFLMLMLWFYSVLLLIANINFLWMRWRPSIRVFTKQLCNGVVDSSVFFCLF